MHSFRNNAHLEGNLGKDAVTTSTPNGDVVNFSIAVNERWQDTTGNKVERTDWFDIEVWGPLTKLATTLKKGTPVAIDAKIKPGSYTKDDVTHRVVSFQANVIRKIDYTPLADTEAGAEATPF